MTSDVWVTGTMISSEEAETNTHPVSVTMHGGIVIFEPRHVRKPAFCTCENKYADQLRGYHEADQRLCLRYTYSTIPLLPKSQSSNLFIG